MTDTPPLTATLTEALAEVVTDHSYTYPDSFCECGHYLARPDKEWAHHLAAALAPVVEADREAYVAARLAAVEALADKWERIGGDNPGAIGIVDALRAALASAPTPAERDGGAV